MKIELRLFAITVALLVSSIIAAARDVKVAWDGPTPQDATNVEGYNLYEVTFEPAVLPPKPSASANIPSPVAGSVATYRKINAEPIPAGTLEFIIVDARPGLQTVVRAFNFMGESDDSDVLTLHDVPKRPEGVKAVALMIEQSSNLKDWSPMAVVYAAADLTASFFRLDIK